MRRRISAGAFALVTAALAGCTPSQRQAWLSWHDQEPAAAVAFAKNLPRERSATTAVASGRTVWDRLAQCESGGNWHINTGNGYYGGLQFLPSTWRANGGTGLPHQHSREEQIRVAERLRSSAGFRPWPQCAARLGLL